MMKTVNGCKISRDNNDFYYQLIMTSDSFQTLNDNNKTHTKRIKHEVLGGLKSRTTQIE